MDFSIIFGLLVITLAIWLGRKLYKKKTNQIASEEPLELQRDTIDVEPPKFLARLKTDIGDTVWAVSEEDHFLRVYGEKGEERILYRFSDAVHDLRDFDGTSVHLNHWVLSAAIDHTEVQGYEFYVVLKSGTKIPVSGTYRRVLEENNVR